MSQIPINKKAGQIVSNVAGFSLNKVQVKFVRSTQEVKIFQYPIDMEFKLI